MAPFPWGSVIGAVGTLGGSLLNRSSAEASARANRQNIAFQKKTNKQNRKLQMKVNKNQIQWLVEDARKAGINPLAALGSSIAGNIGAPVMGAPSVSGQPDSGNSIGDGIARGAAMLGSGIDQWLARKNVALQNEALSIQNARSRTMISAASAATKDAPVLRAFGMDVQRDPKKFSSGQDLTNEFGEAADVVGAMAGIDALRRSLSNAGVPWIGEGQDPIINAINRVLQAYSTSLPSFNPRTGQR